MAFLFRLAMNSCSSWMVSLPRRRAVPMLLDTCSSRILSFLYRKSLLLEILKHITSMMIVATTGTPKARPKMATMRPSSKGTTTEISISLVTGFATKVRGFSPMGMNESRDRKGRALVMLPTFVIASSKSSFCCTRRLLCSSVISRSLPVTTAGQKAGLSWLKDSARSGSRRPNEATPSTHPLTTRFRRERVQMNCPAALSVVPGPCSRSANKSSAGESLPPGWKTLSSRALSAALMAGLLTTSNDGADPMYECTSLADAFSNTCTVSCPVMLVSVHFWSRSPSHQFLPIGSMRRPQRGWLGLGKRSALE
mmetsp:Transcript_57343/g.138533  ORF Transcript_57343/g.138533 Transcript_57343/m.138533 type:complete len:310 (+) Transcript_57343:144-1073(+)